ncbi:levanase [Terrilactibacillus sp. BCM23-1]|uniref:Levanase n=1 Tax=Terrilactibacillus tamarindi TaxID=2599694 RepID=A0A6N8CNZ3_9BACI|nr:levanase [Terrilactibacillus tamarindi]
MLLKKLMVIFSLGFTMFICPQISHAYDAEYYQEPYRNQVHFSPEFGWMNDPNGLVYYHGLYHMFYQYYPYGLLWGPMHWGHVISTDLTHWIPQKIALYPDAQGNIFSGSIIIDKKNDSGFGKDTMIAFYTNDRKGIQDQRMAVSHDEGQTWKKIHEPIMRNPGIKDWRDPNVFWYEKDKKWIMVLAAQHKAMFYSSKNLKQWTLMSTFGSTDQSKGVWECPSLMRLPVENSNQKKWVLQISRTDGSPAGGTGVEYFVGDFNGQHFIQSRKLKRRDWVNYGADYYAAIPWNNLEGPRGERVTIAWMSNWKYAERIPTTPWRNSMTLPVSLTLVKMGDSFRLKQTPIYHLKPQDGHIRFHQKTIQPSTNVLKGHKFKVGEIKAEFDLSKSNAKEFGFRLREGVGQYTKIGYQVTTHQLLVDRSHSSDFHFNSDITGVHAIHMNPTNHKIQLHIFLDRSSIEVFGNDGIRVITDQIFPRAKSDRISLYSSGGHTVITSFVLQPFTSIWGSSPLVSNIKKWQTIKGIWADSISGKVGQSEGEGSILSNRMGKNFEYESDVTILNKHYINKITGTGGLIFYSDKVAKNMYVAALDVSHKSVQLIKYDNGKRMVIAQKPMTLIGNQKYHLKVVARQHLIKIYLDKNLVIEKEDPTFKQGLVGLYTFQSTSAFQNIRLKLKTKMR